MRISSGIMAVVSLAATVFARPAHAQMLTGFSDNPARAPLTAPAPVAEPYKAEKSPSLFQQAGGNDDQGQVNKPSTVFMPSPDAPNQVTGLLTGQSAFPAVDTSENAPPVDLQADNLQHDDKTRIITASGNVVMVQEGRILRADKITYDVKADKVIASGNVVLNEENGDIHTAEQVEFTQSMKNGFVNGLRTFLADGSRFTAANGERKEAKKTIMNVAAYTPCEPCKNNPDDVVWQIKASEVTYHEDEHRISYDNARFELYGIPIAYTPYFSHADGTIEQKSGFLTPSFGLDSEMGASVGSSYYWAIAPDIDATVGLTAYSDENPLLTGQWRKRWNEASAVLDGGITYSERTDSEAGVDVTQEAEMRGHMFGDILWDMNDKWRSGAIIAFASDDQYLRQYDFSSEDVLESQLYAERFSGRNYASGRLISFQDVRVREEQVEQPAILPEIEASFIGEPGGVPVIGGRWDMKTSMLGLHREGDDQDVARYSIEGGWNRRLISNTGLLTSFDARVHGDLYHTRDADLVVARAGDEDDITQTRVYPQLHIQSSYPLAKEHERFQSVIEPIVSFTAVPNLDVEEDIPNEDSQDVQIDASNLFEANRFPGLDRVEDKTRLTYGLRTGLYGYQGSGLSVFMGQSRRFDEDDNPFPEGSGLSTQESDYVGEINANYFDSMLLNYRIQLASENLASERHEVDYLIDLERFKFGTRYLFAKGLEGTGINESREQIEADIAYSFTPQWRASAGATQDLGFDPGLRKAYLGIDHFGQCLSWGLTAERNLTDDASGDSGTEVLLRIGLKNLGEFQASGIEFSNSSDSNDNDND